MKKIAILLMLIIALSASTKALAAEGEIALPASALINEPAETDSFDTVMPGGAMVNEPAKTDSYDTVMPGGAMAEMPGGALANESGMNQNKNETLRDVWNRDGWPEDVSFAYEYGAETAENSTVIISYWEIGMVNATEERKQEISSLFGENCRITFLEATHSYSERERILTEIETEVKKNHDSGYLQGILIINTEKIYVVVKDEAYDEANTRYSERYGDLVVVQKESESHVTDLVGDLDTGFGLLNGETGLSSSLGAPLSSASDNSGVQNRWFLPLVLCSVVLVAGILFFLLFRQRYVLAKQTVGGKIVENDKPLTRSQTVSAVKDSTFTPGDEVFTEIQKKLKK